jgi:hypothetical protein
MDYVLVTQDKILVERHTRQGAQWLLIEWRGLEDTLSLASLDCGVPLRDVYERVNFDAGPAAPGA